MIAARQASSAAEIDGPTAVTPKGMPLASDDPRQTMSGATPAAADARVGPMRSAVRTSSTTSRAPTWRQSAPTAARYPGAGIADAGLDLHRLDDHGGDPIVELRLQRLEVVERDARDLERSVRRSRSSRSPMLAARPPMPVPWSERCIAMMRGRSDADATHVMARSTAADPDAVKLTCVRGVGNDEAEGLEQLLPEVVVEARRDRAERVS